MKNCLWVLLCLALTTSIVFPSLAAGVQYRVIDLGRMRMSTYMIPVGINNFGQVVGWEKAKKGADYRHGFVWQRGGFADLGQGAAFALNNHGDVVGRREKDVNDAYQADFRSFYRHAGRTSLVRPEYGSFDEGMDMVAINDHGYVLIGGTVTLWRNGRAATDLSDNAPPFEGGGPEYGEALNNREEIAGFSQHGDIILWTKGAIQTFFPSADQFGSTVTGLNDSGQVIGWIDHPTQTSADPMNSKLQAFLTSKKGTQILPLCAGDEFAVALGINQAGDIVGKSGPHKGYPHAVLWRGGRAIDLNTLIPPHSGWILESAHAINDIGDIVGVGVHNGRQFQAFLLTPVH